MFVITHVCDEVTVTGPFASLQDVVDSLLEYVDDFVTSDSFAESLAQEDYEEVGDMVLSKTRHAIKDGAPREYIELNIADWIGDYLDDYDYYHDSRIVVSKIKEM
jgi:hypothetical protein